MADHQRIFERVFRRRGGRLDCTSCDTFEYQTLKMRYDNAQSLLEAQRQKHRSWMPSIYLDVVNNSIINASAKTISGYGYIGIFAGAFWCLEDLFNRMFSHPGFVPDLGDSSKERIAFFHSQGVLKNYDELLQQRPPGNRLDATVPRDSIRSGQASACTQLALDFLLLHEIGHIAHGHNGYLHNFNVHALFELDYLDSVNVDLKPLSRQALEVHADSYSVIEQVNQMIAAHKAVDLKRTLYRWLFSIGAMFVLLGSDLSYDKIDDRKYPPSLARLNGIVDAAGNLLAASFPESRDGFRLAWTETINVLDQGLSVIGASSLFQTLKTNYDETKETGWRDRVTAELRSLYPELNKHSPIQHTAGMVPKRVPVAERWSVRPPSRKGTVQIRCAFCGTRFNSSIIIDSDSCVKNGFETCPICHRVNKWSISEPPQPPPQMQP